MKQLRFLGIELKDGSMQNVTGMLLLFVICIDMVKKNFSNRGTPFWSNLHLSVLKVAVTGK